MSDKTPITTYKSDEHIVDTEHIKTAKELEDAKDHSSDLYVVIGVLSLIIGIMSLVILGCAYHVYNQSKPGLNKVATTDMADGVAIPMDTMGQTNIVHEVIHPLLWFLDNQYLLFIFIN